MIEEIKWWKFLRTIANVWHSRNKKKIFICYGKVPFITTTHRHTTFIIDPPHSEKSVFYCDAKFSFVLFRSLLARKSTKIRAKHVSRLRNLFVVFVFRFGESRSGFLSAKIFTQKSSISFRNFFFQNRLKKFLIIAKKKCYSEDTHASTSYRRLIFNLPPAQRLDYQCVWFYEISDVQRICELCQQWLAFFWSQHCTLPFMKWRF